MLLASQSGPHFENHGCRALFEILAAHWNHLGNFKTHMVWGKTWTSGIVKAPLVIWQWGLRASDLENRPHLRKARGTIDFFSSLSSRGYLLHLFGQSVSKRWFIIYLMPMIALKYSLIWLCVDVVFFFFFPDHYRLCFSNPEGIVAFVYLKRPSRMNLQFKGTFGNVVYFISLMEVTWVIKPHQ